MKTKNFLCAVLSVAFLLLGTVGSNITANAVTLGEYEYTILEDNTLKLDKYNGSQSNVVIPTQINGYSVSELSGTFYENSEIVSVIIPECVREIGQYSFYKCDSLKSITIPSGVENISSFAFRDCSSLKSVYISQGVKTIGDSAFSDCKQLSELTISDGVKTIGDGAFFGCDNLKSVAVPDTVTQIGNQAFGYTLVKNSASSFGETLKKFNDFTVYGVYGSYAETFAQNNGFAFVCNWFPDVNYNDWYFEAVKFAVGKGYFHGNENGNFGPTDSIQRQDFVVVLAKIAQADLSAYAGETGGFSDVSANAYYSSAVAWAVDNNIINGYAGGEKFGVGDKITREQICVILYKYMGNYLRRDMTLSGSAENLLSAYSDATQISDWARTSVAWAVENNIIGGGTQTFLNPLSYSSRAEISQMVYNMSDNGLIK